MRSLAFVILFACGDSEDRFRTEGIDALCAAASDCAGTYDAAVCVDALRAGLDGETCGFDRRAAADCRDALDAGAECAPLAPFDLAVLAVPDACRSAYDCGKGRDWTAPVTDDLPNPSPR